MTIYTCEMSHFNGSRLQIFTADKSTRGLRITPFATLANAEVFLIAGLEAVTSALSFTAYLLAKHQDVQDKVRAEVKLLLQKDGNINYDNIFSLKYLNQVIEESLRLYPPLPGFVSRRCQKDFEFNGLRIPKGTNIQVPARLMHHDPRYWVDPEKFNPDRFSPENKPTIEPMAYIPFGIGPRSCPGSRLAEIELPLIMAKTVAKFKLHLSDEPEKSTIKYVAPAILAFPEGGTWLKMEKI
ncbi:cytochrome P450 3A41-like [Ixodes scapularis]|uniref:cytochrome P450 3A41-like n=1 Tax=Ixodes scapularis TaxID=6945 RepID=UPI001A9FD870|nr:cytochrome P450 3A41-like [Ixodes scapularis]